MQAKYKRAVRPAIIPIGPSIGYIQLSQGQFALVDADVAVDHRFNWCAQLNIYTKTHYAARKTSRFDDGGSRNAWMHREIMGAPGNLQVDHVNGNTLDNRRCNLRLATISQNGMNKKMRSDNSSGLKGVYLHRGTGKWAAEVRVMGKKVYLGIHATKELAHQAVTEGRIKHHGEYARL